jgi:hypothetical protein
VVAPLPSEDARVDRRIQGGVRAPARARGLIEERLLGRITPVQLDVLLLLTSELVTNSVRHARMGEDQVIGLRVLVGPHAVRLEVTDCGPGFARVKPRPPDERPATRAPVALATLPCAGGPPTWPRGAERLIRGPAPPCRAAASPGGQECRVAQARHDRAWDS